MMFLERINFERIKFQKLAQFKFLAKLIEWKGKIKQWDQTQKNFDKIRLGRDIRKSLKTCPQGFDSNS